MYMTVFTYCDVIYMYICMIQTSTDVTDGICLWILDSLGLNKLFLKSGKVKGCNFFIRNCILKQQLCVDVKCKLNNISINHLQK